MYSKAEVMIFVFTFLLAAVCVGAQLAMSGR